MPSAHEKAKAYDRQRKLQLLEQQTHDFVDDFSTASASDILTSYLESFDPNVPDDSHSPSILPYLNPTHSIAHPYLSTREEDSDEEFVQGGDVKELIESFLNSSSSISLSSQHKSQATTEPFHQSVSPFSFLSSHVSTIQTTDLPPQPAPPISSSPISQSNLTRKEVCSNVILPSKKLTELRFPPRLKNPTPSPSLCSSMSNISTVSTPTTVEIGIQVNLLSPSPSPLSDSEDLVLSDDDNTTTPAVVQSSPLTFIVSPIEDAMLKLQAKLSQLMSSGYS
ncbi:hypothetical protein RCL1_000684 [Eukaryota sp. TZLM3-RCL]